MQGKVMLAMSQIVRVLLVAAALALVGTVMVYGIWHFGPRGILVYAAPTLAVLADEAARQMGGKVDVVVMGSMAAVRQVQMGAKPDVILSVDAELVNFLSSYRKVVDLGRFELILVCRKALDLEEIGRATIGLADPNIAPSGDRAIAALHWLSVRFNLIVRQVQMGAKPDVILSVDAELVKFLSSYRKVVDLGRFELILVCRKALDFEKIGRATIGLADPNIAPIGYRAIAALYWLSVRSNLIDLNELERSLSVKFVQDPDGGSVTMDVRHVSASGRFKMREDLAMAFTMLENGSVDCVFAHTPFAISRDLVGKYHVLRMPEEISFANDPPVRFKAITMLGEIEVKRLTAVAIVFTEQGEGYVDRVLSLTLSKYGLTK
jgi:molybdate/tungstate transport system substrate-binding protein